jgi:hypothetical protein
MSNLTSTNQGLQYWRDVKEIEQEILQQIATRPLQNAECIYIKSVKNRQHGSLPGIVSLCRLRVAAECLLRSTHTLMFDAEIEAYQKSEALKADEMKRGIANRAGVMQFNAVPPGIKA